MRLTTIVAYFILLCVFFFSSCLLIILVSGEAISGPSVLEDNSDFHAIQDNTSIRNGSFSETNKTKAESATFSEIQGSFEEILISTVKEDSATDKLIQVPVLKYTSASNEVVIDSTSLAYNASQVEEGKLEQGSDPVVNIQTSSGSLPVVIDVSSLSNKESVTPVKGSPSQDVQATGPGPGPPDRNSVSQSNDTKPTTHEDIPSFSEWTKKQLQEAEKNKGDNLTWSGQQQQSKVRNKNYASPDCGSKVVASNPEALSSSALLSPNRDEYLLNPCTARIWVVIELCEPIQPKRIELANFELFSSSPKELTVYLSDYPSREWTLAANLTAKDERTVQSFPLPHLPQFVKFIKLELHSHYGTEHFCPLSLFRVYGTSEYEVLETVDSGSNIVPNIAPEIPVDENDTLGGIPEEGPKNLFGSAKAAVLSLVRRAAEVLVVRSPRDANNGTCGNMSPSQTQYIDHCITPSYLIVCNNCTDHFFYRVYNLVCCQQEMLKSLMSSSFVSRVLETSNLCEKIGLDSVGSQKITSPIKHKQQKFSPNTKSSPTDYLSALLPSETIAALCNMMAVSRKRIVLNMTSPEEPEKLIEPGTPVVNPTLIPEAVVASEIVENISLSDVNDHKSSNLNDTSQNISLNLPEVKPQKTKEEENATEIKEDLKRGLDNKTNESDTNGTQPVATNDSGMDVMSLDSLFSSLEEDQEKEGVKTASTTPQPKESVFVRLANRIKALETNMSLSSQYLEELSLRYKKQVDELQKTLNSVVEERRQGLEREAALANQVNALILRVDAITNAMSHIIIERESWFSKVTSLSQHGVIIAVEVALFVLVLSMCKWLGRGDPGVAARGAKANSKTPRRKSLDDIRQNKAYKKRRPSEEALKVAGTAHNELLIVNNKRKTSKTEVRRKKKRKKEEEAALISSNVGPIVTQTNRIEVIEKNPNGGISSTVVVAGESSTESVASSRPSIAASPPGFIRTALWSRKQRTSLSHQDSISSRETIGSNKVKKTGVLKKFVKKLF